MQRAQLADLAFTRLQQAGRVQGGRDLRGHQTQDLGVLVPELVRLPRVDPQRAHRPVPDHQWHVNHASEPALAQGRGRVIPGLVVADQDRLRPAKGHAGRILAGHDHGRRAVAGVVLGQRPQEVALLVPPEQDARIGLEERAGALHAERRQVRGLAHAAGGGAHLVQGLEDAGLVLALLRQLGGLQGGGHLGREERQELLLLGREGARLVRPDAEGAHRLVTRDQRHRQRRDHAARPGNRHGLVPMLVVLHDHRQPTLEGQADGARAGRDGGLGDRGVGLGDRHQQVPVRVPGEDHGTVDLEQRSRVIDREPRHRAHAARAAGDRELVEGVEGGGLEPCPSPAPLPAFDYISSDSTSPRTAA